MVTSVQVIAPAKDTETVTIASGAATSGALFIGDNDFVGVDLPATFDGTVLTFSVCDTAAGTYQSLQNSSGVVSITVAASRSVALDKTLFHGWPYVKLTSGTNQSTTDTVITCKLRAPLA